MLTVSKIKKEDIIQIVDLHLASFPSFFLTSLGDKFLILFYNACLNNRHCVSVKVVDEKQIIVGFAIGTDVSNGFYKQIILSELLSFIKIAFAIVLSRPKALFRLMKNLRKSSSVNDRGDYPELLSIAVREHVKGNGIGDLLLTNFETELIIKGFTRIALTTDYYHNDRAVNFYTKNGYSTYYDFIAYPRRRMLKMIKNFKSKNL